MKTKENNRTRVLDYYQWLVTRVLHSDDTRYRSELNKLRQDIIKDGMDSIDMPTFQSRSNIHSPYAKEQE